jgi:hypothetical protein
MMKKPDSIRKLFDYTTWEHFPGLGERANEVDNTLGGCPSTPRRNTWERGDTLVYSSVPSSA